MKLFKVLTLTLVLVVGVAAIAQEVPKVEASADYSLLVYNPAKNFTGSRNLSGGGGALVYNFGKYIGLKAEFQGYGSTQATWTIPPGSAFPAGTYNTQFNGFTYLFGPQVNVIRRERFKVFGEGLFGGAYTNGYGNLYSAAGYTAATASNNGFAMAIGGGLDINASKTISFRLAEVDYFLTRYQINALGVNNQSNFRYLAGIVFNIGSK